MFQFDINTVDVIVIGAGISGLAAANKLNQRGLKILVLEARPRVGGRLLTEKSLFDVPVDLGGSWIHGVEGGNPIEKLTRNHNILTEFTDYDNSTVYGFDGLELSDDDQKKYDNIYIKLMKKLEKFQTKHVRQNLPDISVGEAIRQCLSNMNLSFVEKKNMEMRIMFEFEYEYASCIDKMSLHRFNDDEEFPGEDKVFSEGYNQITDILFNPIIEYTILNCIVEKIDYTFSNSLTNNNILNQLENKVAVTTSKGIFLSTKVLITVPLSILKSNRILFSPTLPQRKLDIMNKFHMGIANKIFVQFPTIFWDATYHTFSYLSNENDCHYSFFNMNKYHNGDGNLLMLYVGGPQAIMLEMKSNEVIINEVMIVLRKIFGCTIPDPTSSFVTRWGSDPFSQGSYSYAGLHVEPGDYDELGASVDDRLYFSGEAVSRHYIGTAAAAYMTGLAAAEDIAACYGKGDPTGGVGGGMDQVLPSRGT